jgi:hypothetical protein
MFPAFPLYNFKFAQNSFYYLYILTSLSYLPFPPYLPFLCIPCTLQEEKKLRQAMQHFFQDTLSRNQLTLFKQRWECENNPRLRGAPAWEVTEVTWCMGSEAAGIWEVTEAAGIWEVKRRVYGKWRGGYMGSEAAGIWEVKRRVYGK